MKVTKLVSFVLKRTTSFKRFMNKLAKTDVRGNTPIHRQDSVTRLGAGRTGVPFLEGNFNFRFTLCVPCGILQCVND